MASIAFQSTAWSLAALTRLIKSDLRLHNVEALADDMSIIFVVNHFTRLETILLPYILYKHAGLEVWSLADSVLFKGGIGNYMRSLGAVSTHDPDRDRTIIRSLLEGNHPWIIFPEGSMIKDKKVVDHAGMFSVWDDGKMRPPHSGAAALALRAEYFRRKIQCLHTQSADKNWTAVLDKFGLSQEILQPLLSKRTVIIPVNITYYPIRAHDNLLLELAKTIGEDLSERTIEELTIEGTVLSNDTDIDIRLGNPIVVADYLNNPDVSALTKCSPRDLEALEQNPKSILNNTARKLMLRYMSDIYNLTTINYDHIFATILRYQRNNTFTERTYRNRIFLCVHLIRQLEFCYLHTQLSDHYRDIVYEDYSPKFNDFISICLHEGILQKEDNKYIKFYRRLHEKAEFNNARMSHLSRVIANEIEPLKPVTQIIREISNLSRTNLSQRIRKLFIEQDCSRFSRDHSAYTGNTDCKPRAIGEPFLLRPKRIHGGVVLLHGYLAAPKEIHKLATYLCERGYVVYGVRLRGHGTSPEDLAGTTWQDWYESLNWGYAIIKSFTDHIVLGGFSTGGILALIAAGRKGNKVRAVFAINPPMELRRFSARLAPAVVTMNTLLQKIKGSKSPNRIFVENHPENEEIDYLRNPVIGVRELDRAMDAMTGELPKINSPTFIIQGSQDPLVDPSSGRLIFDLVGTVHKKLLTLDRDRHDIVNGERSQEVFEYIGHFLHHIQKKH